MIERAPSTLQFKLTEELAQLVQHDDVIDVLSNINEEYYYWNVIKRMVYPHGLAPGTIWGIVKLRRRITPHKINFGSYRFHWNTNNKLQEYLHFLDMHVGGSLSSPYKIADEDKGRYLISSVMEEAIASSQIEGAATTRKKAKEMLRQNKKPANRSEQMILNNFQTIRHILDLKNTKLDENILKEIHRLITLNTMSNPAESGAFRADNDIDVIDMATGAVVHHPPDVSELPEMMQDLYDFFNDEDSRVFIHPLIKASIIHFMLGFIHPFADGNGRTARALFYWYLLKRGYWLTEYLSISRLILRAKSQYAKAFQYTEIDEHDLTYFVLFNLKVTKLAFDELIAYVKRKNEERKEVSNFIGIEGISYRQALILEWYYKEPSLLLTVNEVQNRLAISNGSARNDLSWLSEKRFLDSVPLNKVTVGYVKGERYSELIAARINNK